MSKSLNLWPYTCKVFGDFINREKKELKEEYDRGFLLLKIEI